MKSFKTSGLIEPLFAVATTCTLLALLLMGRSSIQEAAHRRACASNLRKIGQAMYIYAQDEPQVFPAIAETYMGFWNLHLFFPQDRTTVPSTTGVPSPTVDLWALVRAGTVAPKQFICPSTTDVPDPAQDTMAYYDFLSMANLSYGYQYQHDPNRAVIGLTAEPTFPVLADANPYVKGGVGGVTLLQDRFSEYRGNSANHANRAGQNVLFQDGRVVFERGPDVGLPGNIASILQSLSRGRDHCYTVHGSGTGAPVDYGVLPPIWWDPEVTGTLNLRGRSDACLVP